MYARRYLGWSTIAAVVMLAVGGTVWGADSGTTSYSNDSQMSSQSTGAAERAATTAGQEQTVRLDTLLKSTVKNEQGKDLGTVDEIVLDSSGQKISYVVVEKGFLQSKMHAVGWEAFRVESPSAADAKGKTTLVLNVDQKRFEQDAGFKSEQWPESGDPQWQSGAASSMAPPAATISSDSLASRRVSKLIGTDVRTASQEGIGEIKDLVAEVATGRVPLAIISLAGIDGYSDKQAAVPTSALSINAKDQKATLQGDRATVQQLAFAKDSAPNFNDRQQITRSFSALHMEQGQPVYGYRSETSSQAQPAQSMSTAIQRANELIGRKVKNPAGEDLGRIEDLVLDMRQNRVSYGVVSFGGVAGMGSKYYAVPWQALMIDAASKTVKLDGERKSLENAPGFDKNNWPDMGNPAWGQSINQHYDSGRSSVRADLPGSDKGSSGQQYRDERPSRERFSSRDDTGRGRLSQEHFDMRRLTTVIGLDMKNTQDQNLGNVEDVILDRTSGRVLYALVGTGGFLGLGETLVAVPWGAMDTRSKEQVALVDATKDQLTQSAIKDNEMDRLGDAQYATQLNERFALKGATVYGYDRQGQAAIWNEGSNYNKNLKFNNLTTLRGEIVSIGTFDPGQGANDGLRLRVKTDDGKTKTVYAGPRTMTQNGNVALSYGDKVEIRGAENKVGDRDVFEAVSITSKGQTMNLRDDSGKPQWKESNFSSTPELRSSNQPVGVDNCNPSSSAEPAQK